MTTSTLLDHSPDLNPEVLALARVGIKQRPVKIVEHPAFRAARARLGLDAPFTVVRLPVVHLQRAVATSSRACASLTPTLEVA
jgi:hypothetical protein